MTSIQERIIKKRISKEELKKEFNNKLKNVIINKDFDIYQDLHKIKDLNIGSKILNETIKKDGLIVLSHDFDADGLPALYTMFYSLINILGAKPSNIITAIGGREYGRGVCKYVLNKLINMKYVYNRNIDLLITVDHGTTDEERYKILKEVYPNIKIIVTDHHQVTKNPGYVDAFINVHRADTDYSKTICGHMTAFLLLVQAHYDKTKVKDIDVFNPVLPYVALSTIGDVMPMYSAINRYIVRKGIEEWNKHYDNRLEYLTDKLDLKSDITPRDISITIAPFVNTGNRINRESNMAYAMLVTNMDSFKVMVDFLQLQNIYRKDKTALLFKEMLSTVYLTDEDYSIVTLADDCSVNVNGTVAGRLAKMFDKPTICFKYSNLNRLIGSGRTNSERVDVLGIVKSIQRDHPKVVLEANGHKAAFGIVIAKKYYDDFKELFNSYSKNVLINLPKEELYPVEFTYKLEDININLAKQIQEIGPYGIGFEQPVFMIKDLRIVEVTLIKSFLKILFCSKDEYNFRIESFYFFNTPSNLGINLLNYKKLLKSHKVFDVKCNIYISTYKNISSVKLDIIDLYLPKEK